jgi:RNA polymerase sigma-70 factor (ECF subfamily)
MVETARNALRNLLISRYDDLKRRLARRVGSQDVAAEALHETWIRLGQLDTGRAVRRPESFLYRIAFNVAIDKHRAYSRWVGRAELEAVLASDEHLIDPEHIVAMRSEMAAMMKVLASLPERRQAIFKAALIEELSYREIGDRFGISLRSVEREMRQAFDHCSRNMKSFSPKWRSRLPGNVLSIDKKSGADTDDAV